MREVIRRTAIIFLTAAICISGYKLREMSERYVQEAKVKDSIAKYRPLDTNNLIEYFSAKETAAYPVSAVNLAANQFITDLKREINNDITGWLNISNTNIDYPFVISADNNYYLRRDLYGRYALAGTIFMDCRCSKDFTDFNTIIYGHNMKNSSMFGDLTLFADEGFFDSNRTGTIFLENRTYKMEFFAYMIVTADDNIIYNTDYKIEERNNFFEYVKKFARNYREPEINGYDIYDFTVVTLSTCSYQFDGARAVLLATINPE